MSDAGEWIVEAAEAGTRLDHLVAARAGCSRAAARRLVEEGAVRVNGRRGRKGAPVAAGDRVRVTGPLPVAEALRPEPQPELPLDVLLDDDAVVALAKPPGMPTHPLRPGERGTLANALVARHPECAAAGADPREGGFAHRLDADTSGVLIAAKSRAVWDELRRAFHDGHVDKEYLALVAGRVAAAQVIDLPIGHDPRDRRRMVVVSPWEEHPDARPARSRVEPVAQAGELSLVRVHTETGRMHQVRAHLAHVGHPIVGDALYGGPPAPGDAPGHFLHAARIRLPHPSGKGTLDVTAPLPPAREAALARLGLRR